MRKGKWIIAIVIAILIIVSAVMFYRTVYKDESNEAYVGFTEGLAAPDGITMVDRIDRPLVPGSNLREGEVELYDKVVVKTIMMEIENSPLVKSSRREKLNIDKADRQFSIGIIYKGEGSKEGRLGTIEVLTDGTFITSKLVNGKEQYVKGKFGIYTMDYLLGLYALTK